MAGACIDALVAAFAISRAASRVRTAGALVGEINDSIVLRRRGINASIRGSGFRGSIVGNNREKIPC
jgi:hypothetical protein